MIKSVFDLFVEIQYYNFYYILCIDIIWEILYYEIKVKRKTLSGFDILCHSAKDYCTADNVKGCVYEKESFDLLLGCFGGCRYCVCVRFKG